MEPPACFITGHRPARFKFKYNEDRPLCGKIKRALTDQIKARYESGVRQFWVGGAMGVDTWAGEIILDLKAQEAYKDMELFVAIPFPAHGEDFDPKQKRRYRRILKECTDSAVVCPAFRPDAYKLRDYFMVDQCSCGIAVYDNDRSIRSGTGMTINYAVKKKKMPVSFIHPDTAAMNESPATGAQRNKTV